MKLKIFIVILLFSPVLINGCNTTTNEDKPVAKAQPTVKVAKDDAVKAPDFELMSTDGSKLKLSDYRGKIVILDFWATWCPPCREEIPGFVELQKEYQFNLQILGVSLDTNTKSDVKPFMKKYKMNYPVVFGTMEVVSDYGDIQAIPTTFVIDKKGNIVNRFVGYHKKAVFKAEIERLLKK